MASLSPTRSHPRLRPPSQTALRVEALLSRYPELSEQELATLIRDFRYLPILDQALMTGDPRLSARLEAFERDHKHKIGSPGALIAFLSVPVLLVIGALWWVLA